jgi:phosphoglycolate phosphatase-like HAD superfamily hydrolase
MIVVFWDIDGTLLTTGRAGIFAWEDACREVTGRDIDFHALKTDGLTDHQVAAAILDHAGVPAAEATVARLVSTYEARLPGRLPMRQGRVLDGVKDILQHFRQARPDIHSMLLTGNTAAGAHAKLTHYGLDEFFEGGSFSSDSGPRAGIAARALSAVRARFPEAAIHPGHVFVVGDTPHDILCAHAIDARSVAVASGVYTREQLVAHAPWMVLERLPEPAAFAALLDRAVAEREEPEASAC